jgi:hypothetical protein
MSIPSKSCLIVATAWLASLPAAAQTGGSERLPGGVENQPSMERARPPAAAPSAPAATMPAPRPVPPTAPAVKPAVPAAPADKGQKKTPQSGATRSLGAGPRQPDISAPMPGSSGDERRPGGVEHAPSSKQ